MFMMALPDLVQGIRSKNAACAAALVPMLKNVPLAVLGSCQDQVLYHVQKISIINILYILKIFNFYFLDVSAAQGMKYIFIIKI